MEKGNNQENNQLNRRSFIINSAVGLSGLVVAFNMPSPLQKVFAQTVSKPAEVPPNAFIRIAPDNAITIVINKFEMGQGVNTGLAQLIAEELDVDWANIQAVSSNTDRVYSNIPNGHLIVTGGSGSLRDSWPTYRKIGASMRELLLTAASQKWNVPLKELKTGNGFVLHPQKGKISYGELAEEAQKLPLPQNPTLKSNKDFKVIGQSQKRVDAASKSDGTAVFGIDIRLPGMVYANVARPDIPTAKLQSFNEKAARSIPGVLDVFKFQENKIAVIGKNTFAAKEGKLALEAKWDGGPHDQVSSESLIKEFRRATEGNSGLLAKKSGKSLTAIKQVSENIVIEYEFPFLAHAAMEPLNCTVDYDGSKADFYGGFQFPTLDHSVVEKVLGLPHDKINFHITYAGGSFGRRASKHADWIMEAAEITKVLKKPVKTIWTREDDLKGGYYRPLVFHKATLGFNKKKELILWDHSIASQSIAKGTAFESFIIKDGIERTVVEGVNDTPYQIQNMQVNQFLLETPVHSLWWRSVGHTHTAYVMETLMDEIAHKQKKDPLALRLSYLKKSPRHLAVLKLLKKKTNWGKAKPPKGRAWGLAVHESFQSVVGYVVEVSMNENTPKIHKVWATVHCGQVINPEVAKTQIEGGIVFGLSAALYQQILLKDGKIQQNNYDDYEVLRMGEMPEVSVSFVESSDSPTGLGEPGVPPIAPAVANAIFQLTGKRMRKLPFTRELTA